MKTLLSILLILITMSLNAQDVNKKIFDQALGKDVLINSCTRAGLVSFPEFKEMYDPIYAAYLPDAITMIELKKLIKDEKIKIVLGTWCGDSKVNVANFYKVLDALKFKERNVEIVAVDGNKKADHSLIEGLNIQNVPTFIITDKHGVEIGRIVEHPKKTLEFDFLEIIKMKSKLN